MIRSMTGYARAETQAPWGRMSWEIRGVNHRYLDLQFKLPDDIRAIENELRTDLAVHCARGKIECGLRFVRDGTGAGSLELDLKRLAEVQFALDQIAQTLTATALPDPLRVLSYPGVTRETPQDMGPILAAARELFQCALTDFTDGRSREGERLAQFIAERCDAVESLSAQVRERYGVVRAQWLDRLRQRAAELNVELDPVRMEQELVVALQRLDVDEELSRLSSHLVEVRSALKRKEPVGRRLDFLMQELNREANTLSSKSQDAEMTRCAVDMKVAIEQMREQVQNIE
jgi:uncharacterized protein (TIGR00255 family)